MSVGLSASQKPAAHSAEDHHQSLCYEVVGAFEFDLTALCTPKIAEQGVGAPLRPAFLACHVLLLGRCASRWTAVRPPLSLNSEFPSIHKQSSAKRHRQTTKFVVQGPESVLRGRGGGNLRTAS